MPQLPTLTITTEQADRCIAAWGSVTAYKQWLAEEVKDFVLTKERLAIKQQRIGEIKDDIASLTDPTAGAS